MFSNNPCFSMAGNRYVHFFGLFLLSVLFSANLFAQDPSFSFILAPVTPDPGDTATLDVSMSGSWSPSGEDDTLEIVYDYSGFQIDPTSEWQIKDTAAWLKKESWTSEIEVKQSTHQLYIRLIFPATTTTGASGLVLRLDGIIIVIDDITSRQGLDSPPDIAHKISLHWNGQNLEAISESNESPIQEVMVTNLSGQRLGYWKGDSHHVKLLLACSSHALYFVRIRTEKQEFVRRLMRY